MGTLSVYGIGNPLIDVLANVSDDELERLSLRKGTMQLIDDRTGSHILQSLGNREKSYASGGSCPNTMNTLAALGVPVALAGCIGNDELGSVYSRRLSEDRVMCDLTEIDGPTGTSLVLISPDGERTMNTRLGVCPRFCANAVSHELVAAAEMLHFTGYMWDTEAQKEALTAAVATAHRAHTTVVFDAADPMAVDRYRDDFRRLIRRDADVLLANREEARMLLEDNSLDAAQAAHELARWCSVAAIKDGARGSSIAANGEVVSIAAETVDAVDTTGAGDNYAAGLLCGLLSGRRAAEAARLASRVAARAVQQRGAQFHGTARSALNEHAMMQEKEYEYSS